MFRNFIMLMFACVILSACASEPVRLYEGEPLSAEQVSIISNGLTESEPRIGGFSPVKIDDSNKCLLYREKSACEILPGKHALQTNYIWYSSKAAVAGAVLGAAAICFMSVGLICMDALPPNYGMSEYSRI